MITLISVLKVIETVFMAFAAYYFLRTLWNSRSNVDLIGNGFCMGLMVNAIIFMWARW